jgi:hypothetical protein
MTEYVSMSVCQWVDWVPYHRDREQSLITDDEDDLQIWIIAPNQDILERMILQVKVY